jgi:hypothetical protein
MEAAAIYFAVNVKPHTRAAGFFHAVTCDVPDKTLKRVALSRELFRKMPLTLAELAKSPSISALTGSAAMAQRRSSTRGCGGPHPRSPPRHSGRRPAATDQPEDRDKTAPWRSGTDDFRQDLADGTFRIHPGPRCPSQRFRNLNHIALIVGWSKSPEKRYQRLLMFQ